jgi:hypothetical protein
MLTKTRTVQRYKAEGLGRPGSGINAPRELDPAELKKIAEHKPETHSVGPPGSLSRKKRPPAPCGLPFTFSGSGIHDRVFGLERPRGLQASYGSGFEGARYGADL